MNCWLLGGAFLDVLVGVCLLVVYLLLVGILWWFVALGCLDDVCCFLVACWF